MLTAFRTEEPSGTAPDAGLSEPEAQERLRRFGPNELPAARRESMLRRVGRQLREPMALLLMAAGLVSGLWLGERVEAVAIVSIVVVNAAIGLVQEGKAARALEALRSMAVPLATVRRDGTPRVIPAAQLVPGDVILLAAGDRVPCDLLLTGTAAVEVDESLLTGESLPVLKAARARVPGEELESQEEPEPEVMAFAGTLVVRGSATGIAVGTGTGTRLAAIAATLDRPQEPTPLQRDLASLTARIGAVAMAIAAGVFALTLLRVGMSPDRLREAFLAAVALAVAAVPEGLATVVAVALALGVRRMAAHGAIVRRLPAVETLGSTTVIATDKTGTLTQNRMRLEAVAILGGSPAPFSELDPSLSEPVAEVAALCNDASLAPPVGDPLEIALLEGVGSERAAALRRTHPRLDARPFDADTRRMCTLHVDGPGAMLLVKGAPEAVLPLCADVVREDGTRVPLGRGERLAILQSAARMAERGMRVLALARRRLPSPPADIDAAERDLTMVGLAGLRDPLRPEAGDAVADTRSAGIRLVMVTGDHPGTAAAIAEEAGLLRPGERVVEGTELESGGGELLDAPVFARVDPQQKLRLVQALQAQGQVVAVTGDGVNDAPALRQADIGVAMGRSGSDVAREAADMVITDDNLATIVTAVREGRAIYDNIRKVVDYLVAGNLSEITVVIGTLILFPAIGVPLLPLQLLWINLLTDGLPAIALGLDRADPNLMARAPRSPGDRLLGGRRLGLLSGRAFLIAASSIGSLAVERFVWHEPWAHARAEMFTVLVVGHLLYAWVARRPTRGVLSNPWLIVAVASGIGLQLLVVAWPAAHGLFATAHLTPREWLLVGVGGALPVLLMASAGRAYGALAALGRDSSHRR